MTQMRSLRFHALVGNWERDHSLAPASTEAEAVAVAVAVAVACSCRRRPTSTRTSLDGTPQRRPIHCAHALAGAARPSLPRHCFCPAFTRTCCQSMIAHRAATPGPSTPAVTRPTDTDTASAVVVAFVDLSAPQRSRLAD